MNDKKSGQVKTSEKTTNVKRKNSKFKKLLKSKKFIIMLILILILIICLLLLKSAFSSNSGSKYGNRLDGIDEISFTETDQDNIVESISNNEKVTSAQMNIHGKIINIIYNVSKDVSIEDAQNIANDSLGNFSDDVKGFYDIEFIITKTDEVGEEVQSTDDSGNVVTETVKEFPIMGYKNKNSDSIVW